MCMTPSMLACQKLLISTKQIEYTVIIPAGIWSLTKVLDKDDT